MKGKKEEGRRGKRRKGGRGEREEEVISCSALLRGSMP